MEWWRRTRERGLFSLLHLQQRWRRHSLDRQFTAQDLSTPFVLYQSLFLAASFVLADLLTTDTERCLAEGFHDGVRISLAMASGWILLASVAGYGRCVAAPVFRRHPDYASNPSGDIRIAWEVSRLQHLVLLALMTQQAESPIRERAVAACEAQLVSWVEANPFLTGIHYISPTECALRLLAVCYAMDLIRPWIQTPERAWPAVLTLIYGHAELIRKRLSLRLSTPHDTLAAATALIYAGSLFPEMAHAERWLAIGHYLLEEETPRHISHDGGSQEQGLGYLQFSTDLYGLVLALLDHRQQPVPEKIRQVFDRSRNFLDEFRNWSMARFLRSGTASMKRHYPVACVLKTLPSRAYQGSRPSISQATRLFVGALQNRRFSTMAD